MVLIDRVPPTEVGSEFRALGGRLALQYGPDIEKWGRAYQSELKLHVAPMVQENNNIASLQSLYYSIKYQRVTGLVPIRNVTQYYIGPKKMTKFHAP